MKKVLKIPIEVYGPDPDMCSPSCPFILNFTGMCNLFLRPLKRSPEGKRVYTRDMRCLKYTPEEEI